MDWYAADLHFRHHNILVFEPKRPFASIDEHDEMIIKYWNDLVMPDDKCLILGDLAFNVGLPNVGRLNGRKYLIMGNHEHKKIGEYLPYFEDIKSYREDKEIGAIFSHIPVHESQLERWKVNVHGHVHSKSLPDKRYVNISLECTNYKPLSHDDLLRRIEHDRRVG